MLTSDRLTVLIRPDGDGRRGGSFAPLGFGRQPDVVQRVGLEETNRTSYTPPFVDCFIR